MSASMVALAAMVGAGSSPAPRVAADPQPTPFPVGQLGTLMHAKAAGGATADVTLNSAAWFPPGCAGGWSCNLIELTITGTSAMPFKYDEIYVVAGYGGGEQPFTHPNVDHWLGGSYHIDYRAINKMPPLRTGSVTNGQSAHGFIGYGLQDEGDLYVKMIDPDTENPYAQPFGVVEVGWKIHT
ncbi:hypothetical protein H7H82_15090 [Mycobacterium heidelbergense]|uniref:hypothetical protein n=1 Tax=Mycobacterium heidelbergense TaxID=53376 RepID=UPI00138D877E|nr:hypothetical protein [Mycobacterium heidelbergense]MCV7051901.1 hypothetical protein [Mycobacterium heidelbergense]BBZ49095.1 hypothetical protein MHEI_08120 [Mycobacterium heidelbergense]